MQDNRLRTYGKALSLQKYRCLEDWRRNDDKGRGGAHSFAKGSGCGHDFPRIFYGGNSTHNRIQHIDAAHIEATVRKR